jgi:hypothetical protein
VVGTTNLAYFYEKEDFVVAESIEDASLAKVRTSTKTTKT